MNKLDRYHSLIDSLERAALYEDYEKAAMIRNQIERLIRQSYALCCKETTNAMLCIYGR